MPGTHCVESTYFSLNTDEPSVSINDPESEAASPEPPATEQLRTTELEVSIKNKKTRRSFELTRGKV